MSVVVLRRQVADHGLRKSGKKPLGGVPAVALELRPGDAAGSQISCAGHTRLNLLDGFRLEHGGAFLTPSFNGQRLLALLSMHSAMTRPTIAGMLWPEATEVHAQGNLRTTLWRLKRPGIRLIDTHCDSLILAPKVQVDVHEFTYVARRLVDDAVPEGDNLDTSVIASGDLLPGWYDDWVLIERERLRQLRLHALEALANSLSSRGRFGSAINIAFEVIRLEPLRESGHRTVIAAHLAEDNVGEAVRHFRSFRRLLNTELGVEPSHELARIISARIHSHRTRIKHR
jgi:DNA-binding SARP family transcriptional activator